MTPTYVFLQLKHCAFSYHANDTIWTLIIDDTLYVPKVRLSNNLVTTD